VLCRLVCLSVVLLGGTTPTAAAIEQTQASTDESPPAMSELLDSVAGSLAQAVPPDVICTDIQNEETVAECWSAYRAYFSYYATGFEHRRRAFDWQHLSSRIIFVVVILLVAVGIFFAWVQFRRSMTSDFKNGNQAGEAHEIEISATSVRVSSPVLGVIILTLSLAFFYLYLVYVYPITELL
jgi:hypothetical protein